MIGWASFIYNLFGKDIFLLFEGRRMEFILDEFEEIILWKKSNEERKKRNKEEKKKPKFSY